MCINMCSGHSIRSVIMSIGIIPSSRHHFLRPTRKNPIDSAPISKSHRGKASRKTRLRYCTSNDAFTAMQLTIRRLTVHNVVVLSTLQMCNVCVCKCIHCNWRRDSRTNRRVFVRSFVWFPFYFSRETFLAPIYKIRVTSAKIFGPSSSWSCAKKK